MGVQRETETVGRGQVSREADDTGDGIQEMRNGPRVPGERVWGTVDLGDEGEGGY